MTRASSMDEEIDGPPNPLLCRNHWQMNLPSHDASRRLPAELLESVFIFIACDSCIDKKYSHSTPTPPSSVNVSYVCRYWRNVALNCPTLWSYIPATSQRWTEELLARSQMVPLTISTKATSPSRYHQYPRKEQKAQMLSIVGRVINHSERIQKLCLNLSSLTGSRGTGYRVLSKFLFAHLPCLQHLEISEFNLPEGKSLPFEENVPALHTLRLKLCSIPWHALGSSVLTTLHLSYVGNLMKDNTITDFLAMLRRMPHLVQLFVDSSLPNAGDFLSNGEFDATPMISLPNLSNISIAFAPLSAVTALISRIDIPLSAKVQLQAQPEETFEYTSTLDDYVRLASLLGQRINQPNSPKFRSLTIGSERQPALAFSTSERAQCYSPLSLFSVRPDDSALLKVHFHSPHTPMHQYPILHAICSAIPLIDIQLQSVHFLGSSLKPEFWRDILPLLSDVRHIRFSQRSMPNITSMLSLPSPHLTGSWQDDCTERSQGGIYVPELEELELYQTTLNRACDSDPHVAAVQDLYDAIATRKGMRCRLTIEKCSLVADKVTKDLESVGWWEGDQFRVTSNV